MKKVLLMCAALALLLTTGIGATLAMSAAADAEGSGIQQGELNIKLVQQMRGEQQPLVDFAYENILGDGAVIYPSYHKTEPDKNGIVTVGEKDYQMWNDTEVKGVVDQIVTVKNSEWFHGGYVRVFFAFEGGVEHILMNVNDKDWEWDTVAEGVQITTEDTTASGESIEYKGTYDIVCATYKHDLKGRNATPPSLLQIALRGHEADNEFFGIVGDTYETLICAQAIQKTASNEFADIASVKDAFAAVYGNGIDSLNWTVSTAEQ